MTNIAVMVLAYRRERAAAIGLPGDTAVEQGLCRLVAEQYADRAGRYLIANEASRTIHRGRQEIDRLTAAVQQGDRSGLGELPEIGRLVELGAAVLDCLDNDD